MGLAKPVFIWGTTAFGLHQAIAFQCNRVHMYVYACLCLNLNGTCRTGPPGDSLDCVQGQAIFKKACDMTESCHKELRSFSIIHGAQYPQAPLLQDGLRSI